MARPGSSSFSDYVGYTPDLEHGAEIKSAFDEFAATHLSSTTQVKQLTFQQDNSELRDVNLDERQIVALQTEPNVSTTYNLFFISRSLIKNKQALIPQDSAKLRISILALKVLFSLFYIPVTFLDVVARYHLPSGKGYRTYTREKRGTICDLWYILPVRMQVRCSDRQRGHTQSTAGSSQMNPFNYLHLPDQDADIRGSQIALCFQYDIAKGDTILIAVNFLDGRWPKSVEEPQNRIRDVFQHPLNRTLRHDPFFIHIVYLTSVVRWWTNALSSMNLQLITYESRLQEEGEGDANSGQHQDINKALHAMAAHLHRYASELASIEDTISHISTHHKQMSAEFYLGRETEFNRTQQSLSQVASHVKSVISFEAELEKKIQNILALLFNRIQLGNDRIMVANGTAMQQIMRATQEETKVSRGLAIRAHEMTEEMKRDSLSMKTIAILTMFFLPGTSFAALLAMPFFSTNPWLADASRFWVWVILTVPSTILAFAFYAYWKRRRESSDQKKALPDDDIELGERGEDTNGNRTAR